MKLMNMHNKINYKLTLPFLAIGILLTAGFVVSADDIPTSVTVGNTAPSFTVDIAENPASDGTTPTNEGANVTFEATATDSSNEDYYLAVCQTNAISATNGGAPTCPGGSWAISGATTSGNQASVSYTTLGGDAESNDWFAFVCDGNASNALCSAVSQGSGASGSPFKVNHDPAFSAISNNSPANPGATVTFTATASDSDTDTVADTVNLVVCATAGVTGTSCTGTQLCTSGAVASNPTCDYALPAVQPHGTIDAFVYVFDNHGLASSGVAQGTNESITVNDVAPVVSAITLNGGSPITLTEGATTAVPVTATVTDNNSCQDLAGVTTTVYRSGVTYASCDTGPEADDNFCYAVITCSVSGGTCTGSTDAAADYTCTANIQYHADSTVAGTQFPTENWLTTVIAADGAQSTNTEIASGVEMNTLLGYDVSAAINYGSIAVGNNTGTLNQTVVTTATGNVGLDVEFSGTDMTDGGTGTIPVARQEYGLVAATSYGAGTDLSGTPAEVEINILKTTNSASPATGDSYWGLEIPLGTTAGTYTGTNTITAILGELAQW